ncbi:hypothetical protein PENSOL_c002G12089 [Penicillium solitum]|uniref:LysM domain-containing protein n=1 Tax=Penicillium solitum TaxID=60172 RepID=A0A1V6RM79_9EURO|nr:uncharacterized protein PENSOL_c002G12089 [Penicillium solitum]OQE02658.1 hypothetical protein PENSOL_c002G12089 [Penicillium solitum]
MNFTASAHFISPMLSSIKPGNTTTSSMKASGSPLPAKSSTAECKTQKVQDGDSCAAIASRCGISGADFTKYNSAKGFCSKLKPGQHVCYSFGTLTDFSPKPNKDGLYATTTIGEGESCSTIAAANGITEKDIDSFNQKTWGWTGCKNIKDSVICVRADLRDLFDSSDKSIKRPTAIIADGRLLDGVPEDIPYPKKTKRKDKETEATDTQKKSVEDSFLTTFLAYSIPAV